MSFQLTYGTAIAPPLAGWPSAPDTGGNETGKILSISVSGNAVIARQFITHKPEAYFGPKKRYVSTMEDRLPLTCG